MICNVCPRGCNIGIGQTGACRARSQRNGTITCNNYGRLTALALDPIEKKPLARFFPGSMILSVGSYGCNLHCPFCQNNEIAMADASSRTIYVPPEVLVQKAEELVSQGNIGVAFTYNEPLIAYEYVRDCAKRLHERDLKTVLVTNGMICHQPLSDLLPYIDAMNIDLKGFTQSFYDMVGGDLETVKQTIVLAEQHCHIEVTILIIPDENDSRDEMERLSSWLASVNPHIPLHISRFFPRHKMLDKDPTPPSTIYSLCKIAQKYLRYVFAGNC